MSRVYEALRQMEKEKGKAGAPTFPEPTQVLDNSVTGPAELESAIPAELKVSPSAHLVALSEPRSLGAEKFRALATRLENLRRQKQIKSLQVTSGVINEGKTLVAMNLAITLATHSHSKVLLLEGDLHRPNMSSLLGLSNPRGLSQWWSEQDQDISRFLYRLNAMPLWFLGAGSSHEQPSHLLQSSRFAETFRLMNGWFDWIIVDSTPMLPVADANLWSGLVDGTLLVVREGVAAVEAIKKGIQSFDNLKLVGIVLNDASESRRKSYGSQYYTDARSN